MEKRTISIECSGMESLEMIIQVPDGEDASEYVYKLLGFVLSDEYNRNAFWDFVDGIS